jgi:hypothetical protein
MNSFVNKFDKPHRPIPNYDIGRKSDMISAILSLDTHEILQCNLMYKIPFTISDDDDNSLIHLVLTNPNKSSELAKLSVIKFLVNNGVNPDKPNKYNVTPLHIACNLQLDNIVKYLLENYADPNFKDNMGLTAFHYLLSGNIIPIQSTEPTDFIPLITNVNQERQEALNELKKLLNKLLETTLLNIPLYKTLEATIEEFIKSDKDIKKIINKLHLIKSSNPSNASENIKTLRPSLERIIHDKFSFKPLQITIHDTASESGKLPWVPINGLSFGLIKEGNVEKAIKHKIKEEFKQVVSQIIPLMTLPSIPLKKIYEKMYIQPDKFTHKINGCNFFKGSYEGEIKERYIKNDDEIRHKLAFDNASSILNFPSLKYTGGPRFIYFINENDLSLILENMKKALNIEKLHEIIIYFILPTNEYFEGILYGYYILAYYIIGYRFKNITIDEYKILINNYKNENKSNPHIINFINKWENIYWNKDGESRISAWLFNMWSDATCRAHTSNLNGGIFYPLLMLISALNNSQIANISDLKASIINSFKPFLIAQCTSIDNHYIIINLVTIIIQ